MILKVSQALQAGRRTDKDAIRMITTCLNSMAPGQFNKSSKYLSRANGSHDSYFCEWHKGWEEMDCTPCWRVRYFLYNITLINRITNKGKDSFFEVLILLA
jgi:hypothetical protein